MQRGHSCLDFLASASFPHDWPSRHPVYTVTQPLPAESAVWSLHPITQAICFQKLHGSLAPPRWRLAFPQDCKAHFQEADHLKPIIGTQRLLQEINLRNLRCQRDKSRKEWEGALLIFKAVWDLFGEVPNIRGCVQTAI